MVGKKAGRGILTKKNAQKERHGKKQLFKSKQTNFNECIYKDENTGAGEMAPNRALAALAKNENSIPSTHIHSRGSSVLFWAP